MNGPDAGGLSASKKTTVRVQDWRLAAVRFRDERARKPVPFEGRVLDLVGRQHRIRERKKGTPAYSPVEYRDGASRGKRGIVRLHALTFDYDHLASEAAEEVKTLLMEKGWASIAWSSFSHLANGSDDACFRVMIAPSRPIEPTEYEALWTWANEELGGYADPAARDISRLWYVASCPPERLERAWLQLHDGEELDLDAVLALLPKQEKKRKRKRSTRRRQPALDGEGSIPGGLRNSALTSLAGAMRRQGADLVAITEALHATNSARCRPPLSDSEVERIARSVAEYDPGNTLLVAHRTDMGNAERFVAWAGGRFRFVHLWDCWLFFDGSRWRRDIDGEAMRWAKETVRQTLAQAEAIDEDEERERLISFSLASESMSSLKAMLTLARDLLPIGTDDLDRDPFLVNCANGTIDLRTGELRAHDRRDYLTRISPVSFQPDAACPLWESFLHRVMGGNAELTEFLRRAVGYCLTGQTWEQVLFLLYGIGANGKSTFLETVRALLGDYATQADFTTFIRRESEGARNDVARLVGTRFVSAVETESGKSLDEALVKQLTGGDTITARFLFKEFFEFKPAFKIWFAANHKPNIKGGDHGIWRRIRLVPFTITIPPDERDPQLPAKLAGELPGILAWAVRGCLEWKSSGLGVPDEVKAATDSYKDEMDALGGFLDECCLIRDEAVVSAKELYQRYSTWCEENGERAKSKKGLAMGLRERGFKNFKGTKGRRSWRGLRVLGPVEARSPAGGGWRVGGASSGIPSQGASSSSPTAGGEQTDPRRDPGNAPPSATRHPSGMDAPGAVEWEEGEL